MLSELTIRNYILIEEMSINFSSGLNILTGETGAGKSIILEGMRLALGKSASRKMFEHSDKKAYFELVIACSDDLIGFLDENEYFIEGNEVIITREIHSSGRSISRINGTPASLEFIRNLAERLVDFHGQNEHTRLSDHKMQRYYIDYFGKKSISAVKKELSDVVSEYNSITLKLSELDSSETFDPDYLRFQAEEIEAANLDPEKDNSVESEYDFLSRIGDTMKTFSGLLEIMSGDESALSALSAARSGLSEVSDLKPEYSELLRRVQETYYELEDIASEISHEADSLEFDEERYSYLEDRLAVLHHLSKKYGGSIESCLEYYDEISDRLLLYDKKDVLRKELESSLKNAYNQYVALSDKLLSERLKSFESLRKSILTELKSLGLADTVLSLSTEKLCEKDGKYRILSEGNDKLVMLLSTNKGMPPVPLGDAASGGELSRIMLAIKKVLGDSDDTPTMVFDEIDTGISGTTALIVGEKMKNLSEMKQIISITHLPQIAAFADNHLLIEKLDGITDVRSLNYDERLLEISRIMSGTGTDSSVQSARDLIEITSRRGV